jgi:hypothetical protein
VHPAETLDGVAAIYVIDGNDITLYPSPEAAASDIEGYDALDLDYVGLDGTVWTARVEGPKWGPVTSHQIDDRPPDLVAQLRQAGYEVNDAPTGGS